MTTFHCGTQFFVKTYPVAVLIWAVLRLVVKRHIFRINRKGYTMHPYFIALQSSRDRSPMFLTSGVRHFYRIFRLTQYPSPAGHYMVSKLKNVCMYFVPFWSPLVLFPSAYTADAHIIHFLSMYFFVFFTD